MGEETKETSSAAEAEMKDAKETAAGTEEKNEDKKDDKTSGKKSGFLLGFGVAFAAVLIFAYVMVAMYYGERFFPGTLVNGIDCGNKDAVSAVACLNIQTQSYKLDVKGRDLQTGADSVLGTITAQEIDRRVAMKETDVFRLIDRQNEWVWPTFLWRAGDTYTLEGSVSVDEDRLLAVMEGIPALQSKNMTEPENAYIKGYSETEKRYVAVPETKGTKLDRETVRTVLLAALSEGADSVDLDAMGCYIEAAVKEDDTELQKCLRQMNQYLDTQIKYDWNGNEVLLNGDQIKDWISLENGKVLLDEEAVREFVDVNAANYDTYGKKRNFVTTMGLELNLPSGAYGWRTDREAETEELIALIGAGDSLDREPIYASVGACKGIDDIGNSYVEADLSHQHLYLYQNGEIVLETDFVSGNVSRGNTTPPGVFGITYKTTNAVLRGADYETPVKYWMPFNGNIGMHDATWRRQFGGDIYLNDGSHGCINLPLSKAAEIYEYMSKGFPVICYYYSQEEMEALHGAPAQEPQPETPQPETPQEPQPEPPQPETPQEPQPETPQE